MTCHGALDHRFRASRDVVITNASPSITISPLTVHTVVNRARHFSGISSFTVTAAYTVSPGRTGHEPQVLAHVNCSCTHPVKIAEMIVDSA